MSRVIVLALVRAAVHRTAASSPGDPGIGWGGFVGGVAHKGPGGCWGAAHCGLRHPGEPLQPSLRLRHLGRSPWAYGVLAGGVVYGAHRLSGTRWSRHLTKLRGRENPVPFPGPRYRSPLRDRLGTIWPEGFGSRAVALRCMLAKTLGACFADFEACLARCRGVFCAASAHVAELRKRPSRGFGACCPK